MKIEGRNAVQELLKTDKTIDKILILNGMRDNESRALINEIRKTGCKFQFVEKAILDKETETRKNQGFIAYVSDYEYKEFSDVLNKLKDKDDAFIVVLDGIEDPHNLGAIIRTAEATGVDGIIIPKHRSVSVNATVAKSASGALEYVNVCKVTNLSNAIDELKKNGFWIYAADMDGSNWFEPDFTGATAIVIGSEGNGVSRLVKDKCDGVISMPMNGKINSLNASVAAGVLMYEVVKQRLK